MINFLAVTILCTGTTPTTPLTNIEVEVRPKTFSTIRYEYAEGSLEGTAYIQSIGHLKGSQRTNAVTFVAGEGRLQTKLVLNLQDDEIRDASFTHFSSGMKDASVECIVEE